jgi:hypothetical protein
MYRTPQATDGPETVEVLDEASQVVLIFASARDAEMYGLSGEPNWVSTRAAMPGEHPELSLATLHRSL